MKVFRIILGVLFILAASACMAFPIFAELTYAYITAIVAGIVGIVAIIDYIINRKKRQKSGGAEVAAGGVVLAVAILAVIFMLFNISIPGFTVGWVYIMAIFLTASVLVEGITTLIGAFTYREMPSGTKVATIILGALAIIAAIIGFANIGIIVGAMGIFLSIGMMFSGIMFIVTSFTKEQ